MLHPWGGGLIRLWAATSWSTERCHSGGPGPAECPRAIAFTPLLGPLLLALARAAQACAGPPATLGGIAGGAVCEAVRGVEC